MQRQIYLKGQCKTDDITDIQDEGTHYIVTFKKSGRKYTYCKSDVRIVEPTEDEIQRRKPLAYFVQYEENEKARAEKGQGKSGEDSDTALIHDNTIRALTTIANQEKLSIALQCYLDGTNVTLPTNDGLPLIYPFGCNQSQRQAVEKAFSNSLSVIQGPPGTGKTQTILNIIANLLIRNKTVAIVSNNNSATDNVYEKLAKYDLGGLVARLGKTKKREKFFENLPAIPFHAAWKDMAFDMKAIKDLNQKVSEHYKNQTALYKLRAEVHDLKSQIDIFLLEEKAKSNFSAMNQWFEDCLKGRSISTIVSLEKLCKDYLNTKSAIWRWMLSKWLKWKGIQDLALLQVNREAVNSAFVLGKAYAFQNELECKINTLVTSLSSFEKESTELIEASKTALYAHVRDVFSKMDEQEFTLKTFRKDAKFLKRFPIVTSSTFSIAGSTPNNTHYDYVIVDEASQAGIPTGAVCLAFAKNAVIVGDTKQLPVIIHEKALAPTDDGIHSAFDASKHSLLESVILSLGKQASDVETLLCEHYRCHPDIIDFCNKRFYNDELVIMTNRENSKPAIEWVRVDESLVRTVDGSKVNDRQLAEAYHVVEKLKAEGVKDDEMAFISPYRGQANEVQNFVADTVHTFQGREYDNIIFSTTTNYVSDFNDNPSLINVAVSRAKKRFILLAPTYEAYQDSNLASLVRYISRLDPEKRNLSVSKYRSIFDALYRKNGTLNLQLTQGESPAEAQMRMLLSTILKKYPALGTWHFVQEYPLGNLPKDTSTFTEAEQRYMNNGARLDFLIYDVIDKQPLATIEVDGASFHQAGSKQALRDSLKDDILEKMELPHKRFRTDNVKGQEDTEIEEWFNGIYKSRNHGKCLKNINRVTEIWTIS